MTGMPHGLLDRRDRLVLGLARVEHVARAAVHGERLHAGVLGDAGDAHAVAMVAIPARANLQRHGHAHGTDDGAHDAADERLVLQQRRAGPRVANLLRGAAHVDVDDLGAVLDGVPRGRGERAGSAPAICTPIGAGSPS